jgi:WD40 repeat protein
VILYEMLVGKRPFDGSSSAVILKHINDDPPRPRTVCPAVPLDLETVCLKCLAKDPAARYPSSEALAEDLRRWQAGEPITARRLTPAERFARWVRRKPTQAALVLLIPLVFGLTAVAIALAILKGQADAARDTADHLRGEAVTARNTADQLKAEAIASRESERSEHALRKTDLASRARIDNNALRAVRLLLEVDPARRNWEWRHIAKSLSAEDRRFQLEGPTSMTLAVRPDGRRVYVAAHEGVRVWDPQTGEEHTGYRGHGKSRAWSVVLHPDGKRAVSSAADGSIHVWEVATGKTLRQMKVAKHFLLPLAIHPDGQMLAVGEADGRISLWNLDTSEPIRTLTGHIAYTHQLTFAPNGRLYSGGMDGTVRAWDVAAGRELAREANEHEMIWAVTVSPDAKQVWTADEYGYVTVRGADDLKKVSEFQAHKKRVWRLTFSPDGKSFATGSLDQTAKVWRVGETTEPIATLRGHVEDVCDVRFLPDSRRAITCGDDTVRVWDLTRDGAVRKVDAGGQVYRLELGANGRWVVAQLVRQTPDGMGLGVRIWDAVTGHPLPGWTETPANAVALRPDGKAVACGGANGKVAVYPIDPVGKPVVWDLHGGGVTAVGFSPVGDRLASVGADGKLRLSDATTGAEVWAVPFPGPAWDVRFHPDGKTVVTAGFDRAVRLWDVATGNSIRELTGHTHEVMRVAFSPDGRQLASGSKDSTMRVWDWATGETVRMIRTHNHFIHGVAFSPHGRIVDACGDGTLTLYDAATGQETITLTGHDDQVTGVGVSPDGSRIVSGSLDGTVRIWEAPLDATVTLPRMANNSHNPD